MTHIQLISVKIYSIAPVKIDDSSFKGVMPLYIDTLKIGLFQVGFLNFVLGKGRGKCASTVSFDWELLEESSFA